MGGRAGEAMGRRGRHAISLKEGKTSPLSGREQKQVLPTGTPASGGVASGQAQARRPACKRRASSCLRGGLSRWLAGGGGVRCPGGLVRTTGRRWRAAVRAALARRARDRGAPRRELAQAITLAEASGLRVQAACAALCWQTLSLGGSPGADPERFFQEQRVCHPSRFAALYVPGLGK